MNVFRKRKVSLREVMTCDDIFTDEALNAVGEAIDRAIAIQAEWGPRCPDYEPECPVCQAWGPLTPFR